MIAQKVETKLQGASGIEEKVSKALDELKSSLKELKSNAVESGLSDADKSFLKELSNETRDAIMDMRLEVLTASDKSESIPCIIFLINSFFRFRKDCNSHQRDKRGS